MVIVPITGLKESDKVEVETILSRSLYFNGMEPTRRSQDEGMYLLITTNLHRANSQKEVDNLLRKYYKRKPSNVNYNLQGRRVTPNT